MAEKQAHIDYWKREAERNWETALYLKESKQNLIALFLFHLTIEKLIKAHQEEELIKLIYTPDKISSFTKQMSFRSYQWKKTVFSRAGTSLFCARAFTIEPRRARD